MFDVKVYTERRKQLKKLMKSGLILLLGNDESPMNYTANPYHYRQDSTFLYFFGLDKPGFAALIDVDADTDYIFGEDFTIDDIIWMGPQPTVKELSLGVGVKETGTPGDLAEKLKEAMGKGREIHYLPPYRHDNSMKIESLLGIKANFAKNYASVALIKAIVSLRSIKSDIEIQEIESALDISYEMYTIAMQMMLPGTYEREIAGRMEGIAYSYGSSTSFPIILSLHGETLHNHYHGNVLKLNNLVVIDSGAESLNHYASDITRTFPVGGVFTDRQREIYQLVVDAQQTAIDAMKPGVNYRDIHLKTALVFANGLKSIGLMKGNPEDAVKEGAHALFFPHGLGHMMGLDVHDMEDFGENYVGYDETVKRSDQFGLAYLRMGKALKPGYVLTVEPGLYFIPALIDKWVNEKKFKNFIDYARVEEYRDFGGIRIEDNVLVTDDTEGHRVLGKSIPKTVDEIEALMT